jgi:UDP-N-acetylmuramoyl-L-alanyl-D-glutamate--2,6-diaminopimelate ligase
MNPKNFVRKVIPASSVKMAEETYRRSRIKTLQVRYGYPGRHLRVIAVTGTNGKTTTCAYINAMLKSAGYKTAMFTTSTIEMAGESRPNTNHTSVPVTAELLKFLKSAKDLDVDYVILEVTSHALHQHKVLNIPVEVAVFTNLSQDHLDYHGSMEEYAAMKARLFNGYMNPSYCVINRDDERYSYYEKQSVGVVSSYGKARGSEVQVSSIKQRADGSSFELNINGKEVKATTRLPGLFNVYNATAAAAAGATLGLSADKIAKGIATLTSVPGRMQKVEAGQNFSVLVDYAITPDALEKALLSLRAMGEGKVIVVFGSTGDRDKGKRPKMGEIAAQLADKIFLTDDETYTEDPDKIRRDVMKGIKAAGGQKKTKEIADRRKAIAAALNAAKKGDIVLCTGIGHQDYRNMGGKKQPWNEPEVIRSALKIS